MGKGLIVSGGTDGLYTVELLHNRDRIEQELTFLAERLTELQADLDARNAEREALADERAAIATEIDQAVANAEEGEIPDVEALLVELAQVSVKVQSLDAGIAMIQGRMLEARKRQQMLQSVPANPQQSAWCADYTENLTGEVATVEVPAEGVVGQFATWRRVQIRPGYEGRATYSAARDGQMLHRQGQVGYQAFYNAAILPGVQKWRPQYRIGTISAIDYDADTCTLQLQSEDSSAQSLLIDPPDLQYTLADVPIEYMQCDSGAFDIGDRVLIEFQGRDWGQPKVIGFESNPRQCQLVTSFSFIYRSFIRPEHTNAWTPAGGSTSCLEGQIDTFSHGFADSWASVDTILTKDEQPFNEASAVDSQASNYFELFTVSGLSEADAVVSETTNLNRWPIAELAGEVVDEYDGQPVYNALTITQQIPTIVRYYQVGDMPSSFACTEPPYSTAWQRTTTAADQPTITTNTGIQWDVVGWIAVENEDGPFARFFATAVVREILT